MKRLLLLLVACAVVFAVAPAQARAQECGLPRRQPMWIDFGDGSVPYWPLFARPGVVVAAANYIFPPQIRARGADTIYWDMHLLRRVGTPNAPFEPARVQNWADTIFYRAVASSACQRPWIALNELFGASLPAPWSPTNVQYRANVLAFVRRLSELGARPFLLVSSHPFTDGEAGDWWRQVAVYANIVREVYFNAGQVYRQGPILGSRYLRKEFRLGLTEMMVAGVPPAKLGLMLGFHTKRNQGGREGLRPASAWFETVKLQVLAVKQVSSEIPLSTIWSWGWGEWAPADRDPDKEGAACVWLWTRNPRLCDGPGLAGPGFDRSLTAGQLRLAYGVRCKTFWGTIRDSDLGRLASLTRDRDVAYTSLFAHLVLKGQLDVSREAVRAAERSIVSFRFGGSVGAYRRALARAGASISIARGVISDELAQARIQRSFNVPRPAGREVADYQQTYAETPARLVQVSPAPSWLGRRQRGVAIEGMAPAAVFRIPPGGTATLHTREGTLKVRAFGIPAPLGAFPRGTARSAIRASLMRDARDRVFDSWLMHRESIALSSTTCRRDVLPAIGTLELASELPFLELTA